MKIQLGATLIGVAIVLAGAGNALAQTVTTDQSDYPPGATVLITGAGFQAGETVRLQVLRTDIPENTGPEHVPWTGTADVYGSFQTTWYVALDELGATLELTVTGLTSGRTARTTFTDSSTLDTVSVGTQSPNPVSPTVSATYPITFTSHGNGNETATLSITAWSPSTPAGVSANFSPNPVPFHNQGSTLTISTTGSTPPGNYTFTVQAAAGGAGGNHTANGTLTVVAGAASKLAFTTQPSASTVAGVAFAQQPVVKIEDAFGNVVTSGADSAVSVGLTLTTGTGALGGTTSMNAVNGVADFAGKGLSINLAGTDKVLTATATVAAGTKTTTTSPAFAITSAAASAYRITDAASGTPAAGAADQLTIRLVDQFSNTVTSFSGDKNLTFSGLSTAGDGTHPTVTAKTGGAVDLGTAELITFSGGVSSAGGVLKAYKAETQTLNVHDDAGTPLSSTSTGGAGVSLTIANSAPVALAKAYTRAPNLSLKIQKTDLLSGATDANHDNLTVSVVQNPSAGSATVTAPGGSWVFYLPNSLTNGAGNGDTFTCTVSDGNAGTDTKTVTIYVQEQGGAAQNISYNAGGITMIFAGIPNYTYDVQRSANPSFTSPTVMITTNAPSAGVFTYTDSSPLNPSGYYRLIQHH